MREETLSIVDWECIRSSKWQLVFRLYFADVEAISAEEDDQHEIVVTFRSAQKFRAIESGNMIVTNSFLTKDLPPQMEVETAEFYEQMGSITDYVFIAIMAINGLTNSAYEMLDYTALFDAIEGVQNNIFLTTMGVDLPPKVNTFMMAIKDSGSVNPSDMLNQDGAPSLIDEIIGQVPDTDALSE